VKKEPKITLNAKMTTKLPTINSTTVNGSILGLPFHSEQLH
jgi:hypothetical protein